MNFLDKLPVIGEFTDSSSDDVLDLLRQNQALYGNIQLPELKDYKPEEYQWLADFNPEDVNFQQISEDPLIRSAQMSALNRMAGLADTGLSDVDAAKFQESRDIGNQIARSGAEAAMQNAQARGVSGSGLEFANREIANQEGAKRAQDAALAQAATSAQQRALYQQAYGNQLAGLRGQDFTANQANTSILNQMNQMNTQTGNQAQMYNLQGRQGVSNQNVSGRNQAQLTNNDIAQQRFQNAMSKAAGQAGANTGMAGGYAAQGAANAATRGALTQMGMMAFGLPPAPSGGGAKLTSQDLQDLDAKKYSNLKMPGYYGG